MRHFFHGLFVFVVSMILVNSHSYREAVAGALQEATKSSPEAVAAAPAVLPVQETPAFAAAAPVAQIVALYDETTYIAKDSAFVYSFNVKVAAEFRLALSIESDAPVDIIFDKAQIDVREYLEVARKIQMNTEIEESMRDFSILFGAGTEAQSGVNPAEIFAGPFSKQGAFRTYETIWRTLQPGVYSVIVDNTDAFTPSRGDAPVRLQVSYR